MTQAITKREENHLALRNGKAPNGCQQRLLNLPALDDRFGRRILSELGARLDRVMQFGSAPQPPQGIDGGMAT